jgi:membrane-bound serine protease (ClpP class)
VAGLIRSVAQRNGHDHKLAEAMVRREMEYKIGDDVISPAGQLLTLTNVEAERLVEEDGKQRRLLSSGTVESLNALLEEVGLKDAWVRTFEVSPAEAVARYIELLSVLFLVGGLLGLYIEFKTPGFGAPGIVGIILLGIWFWGHHVAGLAGSIELMVLLLGVTLLALELFVIPGFGVTGLAGIILILTALLMAMVEHYPGIPWYRPPQAHIEKAVVVLGGSLLIAFGLGALLARFLPETAVFQRLALATAVGSERGFQASEKTDELVGLTGTAVTPLHPGGIGLFGDRRLNVVARGAFVEKGAPIVIAEAHGNRIVVEVPETTA